MLSLYGDLKRYQSFRFISTGSNSTVSVSGVGLKRRDPFFATQRPRQSRSRKIQSVYFQSSLTWSNWRPTQSNHVKRAIWCSKTANASCQMQSIPFQPREGQICLGLQRYHPQLSTTRSFKKVKSEPYQFYITLSQCFFRLQGSYLPYVFLHAVLACFFGYYMSGFVAGVVVIGAGVTKIFPSSFKKHLSLVLQNAITFSNFTHKRVFRS